MINLSAQASSKIQMFREHLAKKVMNRQCSEKSEMTSRRGDTLQPACLQETITHLQYLGQAIEVESPSLFVEYVNWAKLMGVARGIPMEKLAQQLYSISEVLSEELPPEQSEITRRFIHAGVAQISSSPNSIPSLLDCNPHKRLVVGYLEALLRGDRLSAAELIHKAIGEGVSIRDIYLHVFQPAQHEIGRLWQLNKISVAHEHFCTAATQLIMSQLYSQLFTGKKGMGNLVAACVSGELHELGIRIVSDFFEMSGWNTYYLGANTPTRGIVQALDERKATVLGISATLSYHTHAVIDVINVVRANPACQGVKILVGGHPFNIVPDLWKRVGADGWAPDAQEAVNIANRLTSQQ